MSGFKGRINVTVNINNNGGGGPTAPAPVFVNPVSNLTQTSAELSYIPLAQQPDKYIIKVATGTVFNENNIVATFDLLPGNIFQSVEDLAPQTAYVYCAVAVKDSVEGESGNEETFTTAALPTIETPVQNAPEEIAVTSAELRWNIIDHPQLVGYLVDVATDPDFLEVVILNESVDPNGYQDIDGTIHYPISGLEGSTTYYSRIRAVYTIGGDDQLISDNSNVESFITEVDNSLGVPAMIMVMNPSDITGSTATVRWTNPSSPPPVTNKVTVADNPEFSSPVLDAVNADTYDSHEVTGLTEGAIYYAKVETVYPDKPGRESSSVGWVSQPLGPQDGWLQFQSTFSFFSALQFYLQTFLNRPDKAPFDQYSMRVKAQNCDYDTTEQIDVNGTGTNIVQLYREEIGDVVWYGDMDPQPAFNEVYECYLFRTVDGPGAITCIVAVTMEKITTGAEPDLRLAVTITDALGNPLLILDMLYSQRQYLYQSNSTVNQAFYCLGDLSTL